ncbi:hypothetical protein G6O67_004793 [Ophiocordyceps sinensis]|uniref:Uncharacterized protein n=1 Tax=Ophiocordyceps sinensis TaxID=72228 RepID=A0A8H4PQ70_9HYPO|nr:hypothetical protein G6O67_004793 [Ophiocordyceps sinensis]
MQTWTWEKHASIKQQATHEMHPCPRSNQSSRQAAGSRQQASRRRKRLTTVRGAKRRKQTGKRARRNLGHATAAHTFHHDPRNTRYIFSFLLGACVWNTRIVLHLLSRHQVDQDETRPDDD